ncbi:MAG TPA: hypothetical protein VK589_30025 [Chryseolinea sp.]|nr:hypothetical protein [Chryseolinea sp.]
MRNELIWQNTAAPGTPNKYAGWDGSGNPVEKDAPASFTFENGVEEISAGVAGLGSPLTQNTLINGATFDLQLGTFLTSPLGSFQVYSSEAMFFSARHPVSGLGSSFGLGVDGGASLGVSSGPIVVQNTAAIGTATNDLIRVLRLSSNTNDTGVIASWTANTSGTAAAGFGMAFTYGIENSTGGQPEAARDVYTWAVATNGNEHASYLKRLKVAGAMEDVFSIVTSAVAPNIFTTLFGQLIAPDLLSIAADPGTPGYLYIDGGTGQLFISL